MWCKLAPGLRPGPLTGESGALDPPQPVTRRPPLDDEQRRPLIEVGVHDLGDLGVEAIAVGAFGARSGLVRPTRDLGFARPLRLSAFTGSIVALCNANRGSRFRSAPLRAFGIEPKTSSPASKAASIPEIRVSRVEGRQSPCAVVSNSARTRCAKRLVCVFEVLPCGHRLRCLPVRRPGRSAASPRRLSAVVATVARIPVRTSGGGRSAASGTLGLRRPRGAGVRAAADRAGRYAVAVIGSGTMAEHIGFSALDTAWTSCSMTSRPRRSAAPLVGASTPMRRDWSPAVRIGPRCVMRRWPRITMTIDAATAADEADLLSEAVPEDPASSAGCWPEFDALCPPRTIFATNTMLLPSQLATATGRPDRVIALHFHLPVWVANRGRYARMTGLGARSPNVLEFGAADWPGSDRAAPRAQRLCVQRHVQRPEPRGDHDGRAGCGHIGYIFHRSLDAGHKWPHGPFRADACRP